MNYTFQDYMEVCDTAHRAVEYLRKQFMRMEIQQFVSFVPEVLQMEAKSILEARHILINAQKAALNEAQRIMMSQRREV
jgi:hypothetical protein